jgi:hypothetical protein
MRRQRIPAFRLTPEPLDADASNMEPFRWAKDPVGKRHQLGGEPTSHQGEGWPKCASCSEDMSFYGQLDSLNDEFCLADCGLIQVFVCFGCFETRSRLTTN